MNLTSINEDNASAFRLPKAMFINLFENDIIYCLRQVHPATLDMEDQSLVDCLHTLIMAKSNEVTVDGFEIEELDFIINSIACH